MHTTVFNSTRIKKKSQKVHFFIQLFTNFGSRGGMMSDLLRVEQVMSR